MSAIRSPAGAAMPASKRPVPAPLRALIHACAEACRLHRERAQLHRLPDYLLKDMGLSRDALD